MRQNQQWQHTKLPWQLRRPLARSAATEGVCLASIPYVPLLPGFQTAQQHTDSCNCSQVTRPGHKAHSLLCAGPPTRLKIAHQYTDSCNCSQVTRHPLLCAAVCPRQSPQKAVYTANQALQASFKPKTAPEETCIPLVCGEPLAAGMLMCRSPH